MAIDAVKPGPVSQPPAGPQPSKAAEQKAPVAAQLPAGAPTMDPNVKMNPGQPVTDEFKPSKK